MNNAMPYALAAVITLALSSFLTYYSASAGQETSWEDAALDSGSRIAAEDIERATEQAFDDFQAERLKAAGSDQLMMVGPLKQDLRDLGDRQREITNRIDAILNGDIQAKAAEGDVEIPDAGRVDELVAQAIVKYRDDQEKKRAEDRRKRNEERAQRRRDETIKTLTERLNLDSAQADQVSALMLDMEAAGEKMRENMRALRTEGGNFDWQTMRDDFRKMGESADTKMKEILNPDQHASYETYKKENPFASALTGGWGGRMGGRSRNTGGGRRGGNR